MVRLTRQKQVRQVGRAGPDMTAMPRAPLVVGSALAVLGLAEAVARIVVTRADARRPSCSGSWRSGPPCRWQSFGPAGAAVMTCALTVALSGGLTRPSRVGWLRRPPDRPLPARSRVRTQEAGPAVGDVALALPFLVLAFLNSHPTSSEATVLTLLLAVLAPAAALGGIAAQLRDEARENRAARELIAETLIEHTVRGERARIARELHDIVAHHISMVAVQAESARLAVPGLPAAAARRLLAIGDTARAALAEMRQLLGVFERTRSSGRRIATPSPA